MDRMMTDQDVKNLSDGLVEVYRVPLTSISANLRELTEKQKGLIEVVANKNHEIQVLQNNDDLKKMFSDVTQCREQLILIKKQMVLLHERSVKLKARAQNISTFAKNRRDTRVAELDYEQKLIGNKKS